MHPQNPASAHEVLASLYFLLKAADGTPFNISDLAIQQSVKLTTIITNLGYITTETADHPPIVLENISGPILQKIVAWSEHHKGERVPEKDISSVGQEVTIPEWDEKFLDMDGRELFDLIVAANSLDVRQLMKYATKKVAMMADGKSPMEICLIWQIPTDEEDEEKQKFLEESLVGLGMEGGSEGPGPSH